MSTLRHIKGIVLTSMDESPELKSAVLDVINCVDADLDNIDYEDEIISEETEAAIEHLDNVLAGVEDDDEDVPAEKNEVVSRTSAVSDDDEEEN